MRVYAVVVNCESTLQVVDVIHVMPQLMVLFNVDVETLRHLVKLLFIFCNENGVVKVWIADFTAVLGRSQMKHVLCLSSSVVYFSSLSSCFGKHPIIVVVIKVDVNVITCEGVDDDAEDEI